MLWNLENETTRYVGNRHLQLHEPVNVTTFTANIALCCVVSPIHMKGRQTWSVQLRFPNIEQVVFANKAAQFLSRSALDSNLFRFYLRHLPG